MPKFTYFGLKIYNEFTVRLEDIKRLPFYDFYMSEKGEKRVVNDELGLLVQLQDYEAFCSHFIKHGTHYLANEKDLYRGDL